MTLSEVADLISSPSGEQLLDGNYTNRRGIRGYYLQLKCGNTWCKVSISHADRHAARIRAEELETIDLNGLKPARIAIPIGSISTALRSSAAGEAEIHKYENSSAVEGNWAEFYLSGNWYMISVSRVDIPTYVSSRELELMADDLLRQQSGGRRRRAS